MYRSLFSCSIGLCLALPLSACTDPEPSSNDGGTEAAATGDTGTADETTASAQDESGSGGSDACSSADAAGCPPAPGAVPTEQLQALLADDALKVLDVRDPADYDTGHVPGALVVDGGALRAEVDGIGGQVAPPDQVQAVFEQAGLLPSDPVVVYGAGNETTPARVVWTLAYSGHTGPVWMLDGGFDQWTAEERTIETEATPAVASSYAVALVDGLRVDAQWVLDHLEDDTVTLIDARSPAEFDGGHIPGAISVDWVTNLDGEGLYLPADQLVTLYGDPDPAQTLVVYCQTGSRASVDWLVLTMLGYEDVRIYDGSWSEWSADPMYPQES